MIERGSPTAMLVGRWGMALSIVAGAVLLGRVVRAYPHLLPNRLPGLLLYELGPGVVLGIAIGVATIITHGNGPRLAATVAGVGVLGFEFSDSLRGQWL